MGQSKKHAAARLRSYWRAHYKHTAQLCDEGVVQREATEFYPLGNQGGWHLRGHIAMRSGIVVTVSKLVRIVDWKKNDPLVKTAAYAYNAALQGEREILRYDNFHAHPGHSDPHHRHLFDWETGDERIEWVGEHSEARPTLTDFIREVEDFRLAHSDVLPAPTVVADLEKCRELWLLPGNVNVY